MRAKVIGAAAILALVACGCAPQTRVDVQVEPRGGQSFVVTYSGLAGSDRLDLGPKDPARDGAWAVETAGVVLATEAGRDVLAPSAKGGALPAVVVVRIVAEPMPAPTASIMRLGVAGGLVRTARVAPAPASGAAPTRLALAGGGGWTTFADASRAPAYVLAGEAEVKSAATTRFVFEKGTPAWIVAEGDKLATRLAPALDARVGRAPKRPLEIFVGLEDAAEGLGVETARAEGQAVLELSGDGWRDASPDSAELFYRAAASELGRHWLADRVRIPDTWIGDGLADALADEALVAAGFWTADDAGASVSALHAACAQSLGASGFSVVSRRRQPARVCAHVFARAAAGEKGVAVFARDLARAAGKSQPDVEDFLKVAGRHAGAHNAALMRTLMTASGVEAKDALNALALSK